jgi:hypothetical protein
VTLNVQHTNVSDNLICCCCRVLLFLQGLLKGEGKARYGYTGPISYMGQ